MQEKKANPCLLGFPADEAFKESLGGITRREWQRCAVNLGGIKDAGAGHENNTWEQGSRVKTGAKKTANGPVCVGVM